MPVTELPLVRCSGCGAQNRVDREKLAAGLLARCGRCQRPLAADGATFAVTDATFAAEVERSSLPVLVDMWAPWCGPCLRIAPSLDELAAAFQGRVRIAKLNVDENPATGARFDIRNIPALLLFAKGREVDRILGARPKDEIASWIERAVSSTKV